MKLLITILRAARCRSTHHHFAMDALPLVSTPKGQRLSHLLLHFHEPYLIGAKDPDKTFRDFRNHVLHVRDNYWGGAPAAAEKWYRKLTETLEAQQWSDAAYVAGVLSHYFSDPIMPLHTAQSDRESVYHRPLEWSVTKSYNKIRRRWKSLSGNQTETKLARGPNWLRQSLTDGARLANSHYDDLLDQYDLKRGSRNPTAGFNKQSIDMLAQMFAFVIPGWAQVLERAADEARVEIPEFPINEKIWSSILEMPSHWVTRRIEDKAERAAVQALFDEYQSTGSVTENLPVEVATVRAEREVDRIREQAVDATSARELRDKAVRRPDTVVSVRTSPPKQEPTDVIKPKTKKPREIRYVDAPAASVTPDVKAKSSDAEVKSPKQSDTPTPVDVIAPASSDVDSAIAKPTVAEATIAEAPVAEAPAVENPAAETADSNTPPSQEPDVIPIRESVRADNETPDSSKHDEIVGKFDAAVEAMRRDSKSRLSRRQRQKAANDRLRAARERRDRDLGSGRILGPTNSQPRQETRKLAKPTVPKRNRNESSGRRSRLSSTSDLVDAPSIGPKTAARFRAIGITTVGQFLAADPATMANELSTSWINESKLIDWQDQARLVCDIASLCGYKSQLLVGVGCRDSQQLAQAKPSALQAAIADFSITSEGRRALRSSAVPALEEVAEWINEAISRGQAA